MGGSRAARIATALAGVVLCACGAGAAPAGRASHAPSAPPPVATVEPTAAGRASLQGPAADAAPPQHAAVPPAGPEDLRLTLVASVPTVAPDGVVWLEARVTNTTAHALAMSIAIPESIEATDENGARNPAPGPTSSPAGPRCPEAACAAARGSIPRAVTLTPGDAMKVSFPWKAAREVVSGPGCCPSPVRVGPLPAGKYTLSLDVSVEGLPVLVSSTRITVRP